MWEAPARLQRFRELLDAAEESLHNRGLQLRLGFWAFREYEPASECGGGCVNRVRREIEQP